MDSNEIDSGYGNVSDNELIAELNRCKEQAKERGDKYRVDGDEKMVKVHERMKSAHWAAPAAEISKRIRDRRRLGLPVGFDTLD